MNHAKSFQARTFFNSLLSKSVNQESVRSEYGVRMKANWDDATFMFCINGSYGRYFSDLLASRRYDFAFLDVGANQGLYSLIAAKNPLCSRAVAFEPVRSTFELLKENIRLNAADNVVPCNFGISSSRQVMDIALKTKHSGAASLHHQFCDGASEKIEVRTAEDAAEYVPEQTDLVVKVDTEGHEKVVIEQLMGASYAPQISLIFYEVDEDWIEPRKIETLLRDAGFSIFEKVGQGRHYDVLTSR